MATSSPPAAALRARCALAALLLTAGFAQAQSLEPRSYSNAPVGLNFLLAGYAYADGKIAFDPSTSVTDANFHTNSGVFAYARALDAWGKSAKVDVIIPYTQFDGNALVGGVPKTREVSGLNDPRLRLSMNFYGAPALSLKDFADYRQDLIVGASLQVSAPLGQYDNSRLINLGDNRWSFKPELGISQSVGPWTFEFMPSVTLYTDNSDFNRGHRFAQEPLYAVQGHAVYNFRSGIWLAVNGTWFQGNRTSVDGVKSDNEQRNTRLGLTLALPVDRYNSVKLYASTGTSTRTGSDFDAIGIAWQYRWGGGY